VAPLDRQDFARGLLRPLEPGLFRLLSDRGLPDQLLLHLLVSRFDEGASGRSIVNDPNDRYALDPAARATCAEAAAAAQPPCDRFQAVVDSLTRHGRLLFNGYTRLVPHGPRLTRVQAADPQILAAAREPGMALRPDGPGWRLYRFTEQIVICIPSPPGVVPATRRWRWTASRRRFRRCRRRATPAPPTRSRTPRPRPAAAPPAACPGTCAPWTRS
jgi:hypothetical protein